VSKLSSIGRPWVAFNEHDPQHRAWYAEFVRTGTWGRIPIRFIVTDDRGDLVSMIERKLISYYSNREFGNIDS
jgi:hypothetical protein